MNIVAIFSPEAYNTVCAFLGANWYALVGTLVLVAGILIHFIYALVLTVNNYKARGSQRYAVTVKGKGCAVGIENMLALGWIILGGLLPICSTSGRRYSWSRCWDTMKIARLRRGTALR